jgi:hypothetical protein
LSRLIWNNTLLYNYKYVHLDLHYIGNNVCAGSRCDCRGDIEYIGISLDMVGYGIVYWDTFIYGRVYWDISIYGRLYWDISIYGSKDFKLSD